MKNTIICCFKTNNIDKMLASVIRKKEVSTSKQFSLNMRHKKMGIATNRIWSP